MVIVISQHAPRFRLSIFMPLHAFSVSVFGQFNGFKTNSSHSITDPFLFYLGGGVYGATAVRVVIMRVSEAVASPPYTVTLA